MYCRTVGKTAVESGNWINKQVKTKNAHLVKRSTKIAWQAKATRKDSRFENSENYETLGYVSGSPFPAKNSPRKTKIHHWTFFLVLSILCRDCKGQRRSFNQNYRTMRCFVNYLQLFHNWTIDKSIVERQFELKKKKRKTRTFLSERFLLDLLRSQVTNGEQGRIFRVDVTNGYSC